MTENSFNRRGGAPDFRKGRCVTDGYARGWGLQFGDERKRVAEDKLYREAMRFVRGRSVVAEDNRMNIFLIIRDYLSQIEFGHIVEFGSYRGGNALFMAYVAERLYPGMKVYALDTFAGMPETNRKIDAHSAGDFSDVDLDELRQYAFDQGIRNVEFIQGLFDQTAPATLERVGKVGLAHIDCDIHSAVAYSYDVVKPYMVERGYIVFDDAVVSSCLGATEVVEELAVRRDELHSEQIFPHFVFRAQPAWRTR